MRTSGFGASVYLPELRGPLSGARVLGRLGYEFKSRLNIAGLPLVHVAFKFRPNRTPVVARGVIAIGQFGCGVIRISQFGIGVFSVSQFTVAGFAIAQLALAYSLIAQIGLYVSQGHGMLVFGLPQLLAALGG